MGAIRLTGICLLFATLIGSSYGQDPSSQPLEAVPITLLQLDERIAAAKRLLQQNDAQRAYELLNEVEFDAAGNEEFDYLLGVAALDSGKADRATLALDRVLAVNPRHAGALIDRGRANLALGNRNEARADFEQALALNPAPALRQRLEQFIAQTDDRAARGSDDRAARGSAAAKGERRAYISLGAGYDSNVNFATDERQVTLPIVPDLPLELAPDNVRLSDSFMSLGVGGEVDGVLSGNTAWSLSGNAWTKRNQDVSQYNVDAFDLRTGPRWQTERQRVRARVGAGLVRLNDTAHRRQTGFGADWNIALTPATSLGVAGLYSRLRYQPPDLRVFNTNQSTISSFISYEINKEKQSGVLAGLAIGEERQTQQNPFGNKSFYSIGVAGRFALSARDAISVGAGLQRARYDRENALFLVKRKEHRVEVNLGWSRQLNKGLSLRPQLSWAKQNANISIYDYRRWEAVLQLRKEFQ